MIGARFGIWDRAWSNTTTASVLLTPARISDAKQAPRRQQLDHFTEQVRQRRQERRRPLAEHALRHRQAVRQRPGQRPFQALEPVHAAAVQPTRSRPRLRSAQVSSLIRPALETTAMPDSNSFKLAAALKATRRQSYHANEGPSCWQRSSGD